MDRKASCPPGNHWLLPTLASKSPLSLPTTRISWILFRAVEPDPITLSAPNRPGARTCDSRPREPNRVSPQPTVLYTVFLEITFRRGLCRTKARSCHVTRTSRYGSNEVTRPYIYKNKTNKNKIPGKPWTRNPRLVFSRSRRVLSIFPLEAVQPIRFWRCAVRFEQMSVTLGAGRNDEMMGSRRTLVYWHDAKRSHSRVVVSGRPVLLSHPLFGSQQELPA